MKETRRLTDVPLSLFHPGLGREWKHCVSIQFAKKSRQIFPIYGKVVAFLTVFAKKTTFVADS